MKANELRIGNYTDKGMVKSFYEHGIHVGMGKCYLFRDLNPIPITEEVLLKCGFVNNEPTDWGSFTLGNINFLKEDGNKMNGLYMNGYRVADIRYLHQLQSLYFDITGKELEVKP